MELYLSECKRLNEIPFSLVEDYINFFNFILPPKPAEVLVVIPEGKIGESEVIRYSISKIRQCNVKILVSNKIKKKFILCMK
ncbi:DUF4898 domain-containing protein [Acidianus sp. HS-5]|uniref:DUF4898 domain-containing protein n=1 Tax=Acidianus sp. HS-5 TaxID=2886040 RepID=UPI001F1CCCB6|nr:DUF4898 domain-containing protein [Acidianus sp. HS-5]BDC17814.1 hypothetical protein HS5_07040 [Acidianus sp. HS-5]